MDLYTPDTFALANPDSAVQARQLQAVSAKVGVDLTPEKVAVPGLRYRVALNFSYDGDALAEIAYTDAGGAPVLFCVIANGKPDAAPRADQARRALLCHLVARGTQLHVRRAHDGATGRGAGSDPRRPVLRPRAGLFRREPGELAGVGLPSGEA